MLEGALSVRPSNRPSARPRMAMAMAVDGRGRGHDAMAHFGNILDTL